jgi:hypothetical protein
VSENIQIAHRLGQRDDLLQHALRLLHAPHMEEREATLGLGIGQDAVIAHLAG